jgi:hypothetical protein
MTTNCCFFLDAAADTVHEGKQKKHEMTSKMLGTTSAGEGVGKTVDCAKDQRTQ